MEMSVTEQRSSWPPEALFHATTTSEKNSKNSETESECNSNSSSSAALYSLSDISLSSKISTLSEKKWPKKNNGDNHDSSANINNLDSELMFLPPSNSNTGTPAKSRSMQGLDGSSMLNMNLAGHNNSEDGHTEILACSSNSSHSQSSEILSGCEFDVASMIAKLEAQREYLLGSFSKPATFPKDRSLQLAYPQDEKMRSMKIKDRLHKLGKAARRFIKTRIFRRQPLMQRCDIELRGYQDGVEQLIVVCRSETEPQAVHLSMPAFFETDRVSLSRFMLPNKAGVGLTVSIYGVGSGPKNNQFLNFCQVLLSGTCIVHTDCSSCIMTGKLELQPHRPCHSLLGHSRGVQSHGSSVEIDGSGTNDYLFHTQPNLIAGDLMELCVLQTAQPFQEHFALCASSCDHPATFPATLTPATYQAVGSYRMSRGPVPSSFTVVSATPTVFFTSHTSKAEVVQDMKQAEQSETGNKEARLLSSLLLLTPPGFHLQSFLNTLRSEAADSPVCTPQHGLFLCAWDTGVAGPDQLNKLELQQNDFLNAIVNPRLPFVFKDYATVPCLSLFNMNMHLYFAKSWVYYDKRYVTLVLCRKGSPCQRVCKNLLRRLDPYDNPFLFRKRCFEPEPSIAVYASDNVNVEVIFSNSQHIMQLVNACSENVYFSKVRVHD